nr:MAG TPA: hypothetical protein [Caudoviricetes sp.]
MARFFCAGAIYPYPYSLIAFLARFKRLLNTIAAPLSKAA